MVERNPFSESYKRIRELADSVRRLDVLIQAEPGVRVPLSLEFAEPLVILAERVVDAVIVIVIEVVSIDPAGGVGCEGPVEVE